MMNVLDLAQRKVKLRKVAGTKGGEWQGPCPGCGGNDRFHVWPDQKEGKGSYWCRGCSQGGDNIQFLIDFEGLSFKEACEQLHILIADHRDYRSPAARNEKPKFEPNEHKAPADLWQEKAEKFIDWAQKKIANNAEGLAWLAERGISADVAADHKLGWNPEDYYRARKAWGLPELRKDDGSLRALWIPKGLVIPHIVDSIIHRIRIRRPEGDPRYFVFPGSSMSIMVLEPSRRAFVVVEAELDAISVAANNQLAGAVALGSVSAKPDTFAYRLLSESLQILNAIDYDAAGAKAMSWWGEHFKRCRRWPVPKGKDPGEAYKMGIDLDQWIQAGLPPALTIDTGDGTKTIKTEMKDEQSETVEPGCETNLPASIMELKELLRKNPGVKIFNSPDRFTVLRNGKYVGGRINELVFRVPEVTDYILKHPAQEIDGSNLV
ncbi:MAG: CHC2 zinc finger domain-containing protein [Syntrophaceae bacterium]